MSKIIIKEAYTARELAEMQLEGLPSTESGIIRLAKRKKWPSRPREGSGGGVEYPHLSLPEDVQKAIYTKAVAAAPVCDMHKVIQGVQPKAGKDAKFTARALIVQNFRQFQRAKGLSLSAAVREYPTFYRMLVTQRPDDLPYNAVATLCERTLFRWLKADTKSLAGRYGGRKGTSVLNRACGGKVSTYIAALMVENRHYKAGHIRDLVRIKFGKSLELNGKQVDLPSLRAFERHINEWKEENAQLFSSITAPGEFKSKVRIAIGNAAAQIERLNQEWQIDASPADAICADGRYSIYAIIDIYSRRAMFSVSRTAKTEASLLLVRKAIMAWGIPETIKTDNGSDFISKRFKIALACLGIGQEISPPFSPEKKSFVERVIGTMQRDLMAILPGFAGHNVADRQRIRDQKDFAARLGESEDAAFSVEMTAAELQAALDDWANGKYANTAHGTTGEAPALKAASWSGKVRMPTDERSLDILLAPIANGGGTRSVTKQGIRIDGMAYMSAEAIPYIGKQVMVRHDPQDIGRIYAFDDRDNFLFIAINHEVEGINPVTWAKHLRAAQSAFIAEGKAPINKERRGMNRKAMAEAILASHAQTKIEAMPRPAEQYSTHAMTEATRAVTKTATPVRTEAEARAQQERTLARMAQKPEEQIESLSTAGFRAKLEGILQQREKGEEVSERDEDWIVKNQNSAWFKLHMSKREREREKETEE